MVFNDNQGMEIMKFIGKLLKGILMGIVVFSLIGVITFVSISCILVWANSLVLIIHLNPNYDIGNLAFLLSWIIRIFIFEVIVLMIYFILVPAIKSIIKKKKVKNVKKM
jgi:hypothetical protein